MFQGTFHLNSKTMSVDNVKWFKHYIGMSRDTKFAEIIYEHGIKGLLAYWIWDVILEETTKTGGVWGKSSKLPHTDGSLGATFAVIMPHIKGIETIHWALNLLIDSQFIELDKNGFYKVINFEKHQHELLSTKRVADHRLNKKKEEQITEVIFLLNELKKKAGMKRGTGYSTKTSSYRSKVRARIDDGATMNDFKKVIQWQINSWINGEMEKYLTPDTLFRPGHFDRYLNDIPEDFNPDVVKKRVEMLTVENLSGKVMTVTRERYDKSEKMNPGYYTIIKKSN